MTPLKVQQYYQFDYNYMRGCSRTLYDVLVQVRSDLLSSCVTIKVCRLTISGSEGCTGIIVSIGQRLSTRSTGFPFAILQRLRHGLRAVAFVLSGRFQQNQGSRGQDEAGRI